jgi:hypothetical protein
VVGDHLALQEGPDGLAEVLVLGGEQVAHGLAFGQVAATGEAGEGDK